VPSDEHSLASALYTSGHTLRFNTPQSLAVKVETRTMSTNISVIPAGGLVVVIGANGYIASETCHKLLEAGYRVRGTVRDVAKHQKWMHKIYDGQWPGMFSLAEVTDFTDDKAFDAAFEGTASSLCLDSWTSRQLISRRRTGSHLCIYAHCILIRSEAIDQHYRPRDRQHVTSCKPRRCGTLCPERKLEGG
jgi:hypothetical protein